MALDDQRRITRAAGVVGFFTLLSRILGLVRDQVIAYIFGAGPAADAFFVAFRIPNLLRRLSAEGAMASAFVPVYTQVLVSEGPPAARSVAGAAFSLLGLILAVISALGVFLAPILVKIIAPGFLDDPAKFELTVLLTRIVFPYVLFISLATLLMSQLNAWGHFAAPAAAPMALNISLIAFAFGLGPHLDRPAVALAWGALVGGAAQLAMQAPPLLKRGAWPPLMWRPKLAAVRRMARRMVPVIFGAAVYQVNLLIGTLLASLLPTGAVSFLYYADRLVQFPLGVFGLALGQAVLPTLSRQAAENDFEGLSQSTAHAFGLSLFIILPSAVGLALLAEPIVGLIYQHGRFDAAAARMSALALWAFTPGLPLAALVFVAVRVFNALGDTRTPALLGAVSVAANIALSLILMGPLAHAGLALASSLAAGVNLWLLYWSLMKKAPDLKKAGLFKGAGRIFLAAGGLALVVGFINLCPASPLHEAARWLRVVSGILVGAGVYFILTWLLKCPELRALRQAVTRG